METLVNMFMFVLYSAGALGITLAVASVYLIVRSYIAMVILNKKGISNDLQ